MQRGSMMKSETLVWVQALLAGEKVEPEARDCVTIFFSGEMGPAIRACRPASRFASPWLLRSARGMACRGSGIRMRLRNKWARLVLGMRRTLQLASPFRALSATACVSRCERTAAALLTNGDCTTDIVNFAEIQSRLRPEEVARMLDRLYTKYDHLSHTHNVFKVETIGDAYMVSGSLSVPGHRARTGKECGRNAEKRELGCEAYPGAVFWGAGSYESRCGPA